MALAASILCENGAQRGQMACGECKSCQLFANDTHPDFFKIVPEEPGKPALSPFRIAMVSPSDAMNDNAANALLKSLEEPPDNVWIVLISSAPQKLLPTIRSRCQQVPVTVPSVIEAKQWVMAQSGIVNEEAIDTALGMAQGAPLLAVEHLIEGRVEIANEILTQLQSIAFGGMIEPDLPTSWAVDARTTWACLAFWVSQLSLAPHRESAMPALQPLLEKTPASGWSPIWEGILEGRAALDRPFRQDLLLGRWLGQWQSFTRQ